MEINAKSTVNDLQSILKQSFGKDVIVESYQVKDFLGPGENYGSKIVSVDAKIRKNKSSGAEDLHAIAKLPPPTRHQREMFNSPHTFKKEIFMYSEILPAYKKLEIDCGVSEAEAYNSSAIFYGSRLSLDPEVNFDDDAAILLENLKFRGFYMVDRRIGCDLNHAKIAVTALARFHSLGIAVKHKNPKFFEYIKINCVCNEFNDLEDWERVKDSILKGIKGDPEIGQYYELCVGARAEGKANSWRNPPDEPWSTIVHMDFWTNNFLFHQSADGVPDDVKFVDFQNNLFLSPLRDLAFFFGVSVDVNVLDNHYDELVNLYYKVLIQRLTLLNCDTGPYSRDTFDKKLHKDSRIEFSHCLCLLKAITINSQNIDPDKDVKKLLQSSVFNDLFLNKCRAYVESLFKRGILDD